jgi:hypothetical protein
MREHVPSWSSQAVCSACACLSLCVQRWGCKRGIPRLHRMLGFSLGPGCKLWPLEKAHCCLVAPLSGLACIFRVHPRPLHRCGVT